MKKSKPIQPAADLDELPDPSTAFVRPEGYDFFGVRLRGHKLSTTVLWRQVVTEATDSYAYGAWAMVFLLSLPPAEALALSFERDRTNFRTRLLDFIDQFPNDGINEEATIRACQIYNHVRKIEDATKVKVESSVTGTPPNVQPPTG